MRATRATAAPSAAMRSAAPAPHVFAKAQKFYGHGLFGVLFTSGGVAGPASVLLVEGPATRLLLGRKSSNIDL